LIFLFVFFSSDFFLAQKHTKKFATTLATQETLQNSLEGEGLIQNNKRKHLASKPMWLIFASYWFFPPDGNSKTALDN